MPTKLTDEIINAAIVGFEQQKIHIDAQIAELRAVLPGGSTESATTPKAPIGKRRKMSAAGRKAIAEGQRKRWAGSKNAAEPSAPAAAPKPKRKLSKEGRANIVAATKKRWDAVRAAKAQEEKASVTKKAAVKKSATKAPVKKAAKKTAALVKKAVTKKTAPAAAAPAPEAATK